MGKDASIRYLRLLFALLLATAPVGLACSVNIPETSAGPRFQVKVSGYEGPVKGLLLNLTDTRDRVLAAVTDQRGIASFQNVPPGNYYLSADRDNGFGSKVVVRENGPANVVIGMKWPALQPVRTRTLSGSLRAPYAVPGNPDQPILTLELLEGISGRIVATTSTTNRGEFAFGEQAPGIYFIHLKPFLAFHEKVEGLISITVDRAARAEQLDLNLEWSSCGLGYTDLMECARLELLVHELAGHVGDPMGRAGRRTEIVLLDSGRNVVAHTWTDSEGNFTLASAPIGTFELRIEGPAIPPGRATIHMEPSSANPATGRSLLEIETGFASCSTIRMK